MGLKIDIELQKKTAHIFNRWFFFFKMLGIITYLLKLFSVDKIFFYKPSSHRFPCLPYSPQLLKNSCITKQPKKSFQKLRRAAKKEKKKILRNSSVFFSNTQETQGNKKIVARILTFFLIALHTPCLDLKKMALNCHHFSTVSNIL